jgi:hypothetical protein
MRVRSVWLAGAMDLVACDASPRMHSESSTVPSGTDVVVTFDDPQAGHARRRSH